MSDMESRRFGFRFSTALSGGLSTAFPRAWPAMIVNAALSVAPPVLFVILGLRPMQFGAMGVPPGRSDLLAVIAVVALTGALATLFVQATTTVYAVDELESGRGDWADAARRALLRLPMLVVLSILSGVAIVVGFILLVVPGLFLLSMWFVIVPALLVERRGLFESFSRARQLTSHHRWSMLGLLVVMAIIQFGASIAGGVLAGLVAGATRLPIQLVQPCINSGVAGACAIVSSVVVSSTFAELRRARGESSGAGVAATFD